MSPNRPEKKVAVVLHARQAYVEWINILEEDHNICLNQIPPSVYLLEQKKLSAEPDSILRRYYKAMFDKQLQNWWQYPSAWPKKRDYRLFKLWFDAEVIREVCEVSSIAS
ncbi:MAG: hypothetical protein Q7J34_04610 [Bacteroidales bacterium]|jgi:hypothetical protein|nr:hypothetical protein [Bacteroidales bacterium]